MDANKNIIVPKELVAVIENEVETRKFFYCLPDEYRRSYCDWVGGAKQPATRESRAGEALLMLKKRCRTLKS
jgi:uncharacterized protein YdeI (YjbR/CyaY-like superfamily)